jgi:hypothetical protein
MSARAVATCGSPLCVNPDHLLIKKRNHHIEEKRRVRNEAKAAPCADCGVQYPYYVMDFDHRPDEVKLFEMSDSYTLRMELMLAEIAKCDVVCANCHRERTHTRRQHLG